MRGPAVYDALLVDEEHSKSFGIECLRWAWRDSWNDRRARRLPGSVDVQDAARDGGIGRSWRSRHDELCDLSVDVDLAVGWIVEDERWFPPTRYQFLRRAPDPTLHHLVLVVLHRSAACEKDE